MAIYARVWEEIAGRWRLAWAEVAAAGDAPGGGSLPAWWTVDSTADNEIVTFGGQVIIEPALDSAYGLRINLPTDFDDNANARIVLYNGLGEKCLQYDSGGLDLLANAGENTKVHMTGNDASELIFGPDRLEIYTPTDAGSPWLHAAHERGLQMKALTPTQISGTSRCQLYYQDTVGAPKFIIDGWDSNGDPFSAEITLT